MKRISILTAAALAAVLAMTACGGGSGASSAGSEEAVQESIAEAESEAEVVEEAVEAAEETVEEDTEEPAALSVTIDDPDRGVSYEVFYPEDGVDVEETSVFDNPGYTFRSESEGCYITVYTSGMYTSDIQSRLDDYDNVTYGEHNGWYEYTSYAAEGNMVGEDNGEGFSRLLAFKAGNIEESPAEHSEIDAFLESGLVNFVLTNYQASYEAAAEPEETPEAEDVSIIVDGVAHLDGADVVIPDGWTVVKESSFSIKMERDEKVPPRVEGDDPLTATMTVNASAKIEGSAQEWIDSLNENFGGDNEILSASFGDNDWVYFCPVEDQFYMCTDTGLGTYVEVDGMFFTINDEIENFLAGITVKR